MSKYEDVLLLCKSFIQEECLRVSSENFVCDIEDYQQEARLAVLESIHSYNPQSGLSLLDYVKQGVRDAILCHAARFSSHLSFAAPQLSFDQIRDIHIGILRSEFSPDEISDILLLDSGVPDAISS